MKRPPTPLPMHEFTIGHVRVSVHCRTPSKPTPDARVTFERRHDTKRDEWYPAASFLLADLDALVQALSEVRHNPFGNDGARPASTHGQPTSTPVNGTTAGHADASVNGAVAHETHSAAGTQPQVDKTTPSRVTHSPRDLPKPESL